MSKYVQFFGHIHFEVMSNMMKLWQSWISHVKICTFFLVTYTLRSCQTKNIEEVMSRANKSCQKKKKNIEEVMSRANKSCQNMHICFDHIHILKSCQIWWSYATRESVMSYSIFHFSEQYVHVKILFCMHLWVMS